MTDRRTLNRIAHACVALEDQWVMDPRDRRAATLAYTLCRVVILGMNGLDQTAPGSKRTGKSRMTLSDGEIVTRLKEEFDDLMEVIDNNEVNSTGKD